LPAASILIALTLSLSAHAAVIQLTGGDNADAVGGPAFSATGTFIEAYRMTTAGEGRDELAYTYKGITFQPFVLNGNGAHTTANVTTETTGPYTAQLTNGFFYQLGTGANVGVGGGALSQNDTDLANVAQYMAYATNGNRGDTSGTMTLVLSGLSAGTTYQIDLFAGDSYDNRNLDYVYTMTGAGAPTSDTVAAPRTFDAMTFRSDVYDVR